MARMVSLGIMLTLMVGFARTAPAPDDDDSRAIIEKAIKAHGGEQRLAAMKTARSKSKGAMIVDDQKYAITAETIAESEDVYKLDFRIDADGAVVEAHCVLNQDKAWRTIKGETKDLDGDTLKNLMAEAYSRKIASLTPLLKDKDYTLLKLEDVKVGGKPAAGIKVSAKGHKDVELYFDKKSGLLVKKVYKVIDTDTSKEVSSEVVYSDFKDFDGLMMAAKVIVTRGGKKAEEIEVLEFERLKKVDPAEFEKPK